jgi:phosphatidylinositol-4,5-bisphosphate 3-kinase
VREYAISHLKKMKDDELRLYLLQITQCLKFEPYHDSPLAAFLIDRALRAPYEIGHHFFWHLKAELHSPHFSERFAVILEEYLSHCGRFAKELRKQNQAVLKLERVAAMIVRLKREHAYSDEDAMREYRKEITKLNADFFGPMGKFQIPLNPKLEATTLIVEKCRYMSSKMVPLWLVFRNADDDAPPIYIIFKSGDDLRQDILTLQVLRVMDKMWLEAGHDMRMKPYRVIATGVNDHGDGVGMIEVVLNSDTTSGIQLQYGGGAMGALKMDPIDMFLHDHNKGEALYQKAVQNFIMSCAGYCVATFVLGIGDRHNGNIMVTKDGHLFHIDFGHFLGNFKKKFGVNRERAAFVFTPEMAYVMGGKKYQKSPLFKKFLELCSNSFRTLRSNATLLENLFVLMVSAGMPELMREQDILYMRDKLYLDVNHEKKADKKLQQEINKSLDSTYRRIDNMIHNLKHG